VLNVPIDSNFLVKIQTQKLELTVNRYRCTFRAGSAFAAWSRNFSVLTTGLIIHPSSATVADVFAVVFKYINKEVMNHVI